MSEALAKRLQAEEDAAFANSLAQSERAAAGSSNSAASSNSNSRPPAELKTIHDVAAAAAALTAFRPSLCCVDARLPKQSTHWDCGYANTAAICATLANGPRQSLKGHGLGGSIEPRGLQKLIEAAWREGFDRESARQFQHRLVGRTGKAGWIGAPECLALLWHVRVEAFVVEIVKRANAGAAVYKIAKACFAVDPAPAAPAAGGGGSSAGSNGGGSSSAVVIDLRSDDEESPERQKKRQKRTDEEAAAPSPSPSFSTRPPLLLQHQGHSRTIIGVLPPPNERLIVRDPTDAQGTIRLLAPSELDGKQYQIVACGPPRAFPQGGAADIRGPVAMAREFFTLTNEPAARRARVGEPEPAAALMEDGKWEYAAWCHLRFE